MSGVEETGAPERGVIVHLDEGDPAKQDAVIRNIANLVAELPVASSVELVVHGPGLDAVLADGEHGGRVRELIDRGVAVAACANTMRRRDIPAEALLPGVRIVPAGIAEVVQRQWQGWAYVRP
ncbi:MAG TPA: DsrE family protein [Actinomycetota bacterium]|nr:DsrE family protein [Actinomycetota bacterium]